MSSKNATRAGSSSAAMSAAIGVATNCAGRNFSREETRIGRTSIRIRTSLKPPWRSTARNASALPNEQGALIRWLASALTWSAKRAGDREHVGKVPDIPPDAQRQPAAFPQDPAQLGNGGGLVRAELQPLLAQHDVERAVREGQRFQVAFPPRDGLPGLARRGARHLQHAWIEVDARHLPCRADARTGGPCDDACTACGIEHTLARLEPGQLQEYRCPGRKDRGTR